MNGDEAKREAIRILANRLKAWDVMDALPKAQMFLDDMRLAGWRWDAPVNRPQPPRAEDACPIHGGHQDKCAGCAADRLTGVQATRPAPVRKGPTDEFLAAREALHGDRKERDAAACAALQPTHTDTEEQQ